MHRVHSRGEAAAGSFYEKGSKELVLTVTFPQVALPTVSGAVCFEDAINWIMAENAACEKHPLSFLFCYCFLFFVLFVSWANSFSSFRIVDPKIRLRRWSMGYSKTVDAP